MRQSEHIKGQKRFLEMFGIDYYDTLLYEINRAF